MGDGQRRAGNGASGGGGVYQDRICQGGDGRVGRGREKEEEGEGEGEDEDENKDKDKDKAEDEDKQTDAGPPTGGGLKKGGQQQAHSGSGSGSRSGSRSRSRSRPKQGQDKNGKRFSGDGSLVGGCKKQGDPMAGLAETGSRLLSRKRQTAKLRTALTNL